MVAQPGDEGLGNGEGVAVAGEHGPVRLGQRRTGVGVPGAPGGHDQRLAQLSGGGGKWPGLGGEVATGVGLAVG